MELAPGSAVSVVSAVSAVVYYLLPADEKSDPGRCSLL